MRVLLHGGYPGFFDGSLEDTQLFTKLIEGARAGNGKVLFASFGYVQPAEYMEKMFVAMHAIDANVTCTIASKENFEQELVEHSVVNLQGGATLKWQEFLQTIDPQALVTNKTMLAGSSAGANMLCRYGFTDSVPGVLEGLGVVQTAVIPHCNAWPTDEYIPMMREVTDLPIIMVAEDSIVEVEAA